MCDTQRRQWQPTPVLLPGESQGWGSLVGCHLWGHKSQTRLKQLSSSSSMCDTWASQVVELVKNLPAIAGDTETQVQSLRQEDPLE